MKDGYCKDCSTKENCDECSFYSDKWLKFKENFYPNETECHTCE